MDYLNVRASSGTSNGSYYADGVILYHRQPGDWKIAYRSSDTGIAVRVGVYRTGTKYTFVVAANQLASNIDVRVISPADDAPAFRSISSITTSFAGGYFATFDIDLDEPTFTYTVFSNINDVLEAIRFSVVPQTGLVVVATATPSPIGINGLVVRCTGRLLDPNDQGDTSGPGGGGGGFDDTSDPIPVDDLPTLSAADSGLVTLFQPTQEEVKELGSYLWTNLTDFIENLQKLFSNPMDFIISFHIVPVKPATGAAREIQIGLWDTGIDMKPLLSQWCEVNCGSVPVPEYWGSALDYSPNTKISAMLPFIGSVQLNTDEIMGQTVGLIYRIDMLSGSLVAIITINGNVMYQFAGECAVPVPLTGADWSRIYSAFFGTAAATAAGAGIIAGAGAAADFANALTASASANKTANAVSGTARAFGYANDTSGGIPGIQAVRKQLVSAGQAALDAGNAVSSTSGQLGRGLQAAAITRAVNNVATQVMSGKLNVQHTGTISGAAGLLGNKQPYLLLEYPNQSLAQNYKHFVGYPSNMTETLGTLSGYTECEQVIVTGIHATDSEIAEIAEALKRGVYL